LRQTRRHGQPSSRCTTYSFGPHILEEVCILQKNTYASWSVCTEHNLCTKHTINQWNPPWSVCTTLQHVNWSQDPILTKILCQHMRIHIQEHLCIKITYRKYKDCCKQNKKGWAHPIPYTCSLCAPQVFIEWNKSPSIYFFSFSTANTFNRRKDTSFSIWIDGGGERTHRAAAAPAGEGG
jgi:hypothetical protein